MNIRSQAYLRATTTVATVMALVVGVTLAAVNTQASLAGTSLSTTSADLLLWNGQTFSNTAPGFMVENIVPGLGSVELPVAFRNTGGNALSIGAHIPTTLKFSGFNSTSATTAMKAVKLTIKNTATGDTIDTSLYNLTLATDVALPGPALAAGLTANPTNPATAGNYTLKFDIDPTAIGTAKAMVEAFDLTFTGKAVAPTT